MTYDVVAVGNAVIDALLTLDPQDPKCTYDASANTLQIEAGRKLLAKGCYISVGGGACRVAIGVSRLGYKTALVAEIGKDEFAQKILNTLQADGVDAQYIRQETEQTSFTVGLNYKNDRTLITNHVIYDHTFPLTDLQTSWIYLGSLGDVWEHVYASVAAYAGRIETRLLVNPGATQFRAGVEKLLPVLRATYVLCVNKEEAAQLAGASRGTQMQELLQKVKSLGPRIVIITDGQEGSFAVDTDGVMYHMPIVPAEIVEKTGAGDAYVTGFLAAMLHGHHLKTGMEWGTINAASVISHPGSHEALLTVSKLEEMLSDEDLPKPTVFSSGRME